MEKFISIKYNASQDRDSMEEEKYLVISKDVKAGVESQWGKEKELEKKKNLEIEEIKEVELKKIIEVLVEIIREL